MNASLGGGSLLHLDLHQELCLAGRFSRVPVAADEQREAASGCAAVVKPFVEVNQACVTRAGSMPHQPMLVRAGQGPNTKQDHQQPASHAHAALAQQRRDTFSR